MDPIPHPDDIVRPIVESMALSGIFDQVGKAHQLSLRADPEWSTPRWVHVHELVQAFAVGVLRADPWHKGYKVPPGFDGVINWIAFKVQEEFKDKEVVKLSLIEIKERFKRWGEEHPQFMKWNESPTPGTVVSIVSRYSVTPEERDFIDLGALVHNAALYIRTDRRENDRFEERFRQKYPDAEMGNESPSPSAP
jgi:hypothetical protein